MLSMRSLGRRLLAVAALTAAAAVLIVPASGQAAISGQCRGQIRFHEIFLCLNTDEAPANGTAKVEARIYDNQWRQGAPEPRLSSSDPGTVVGLLKNEGNGEYRAEITTSRTAGLVTVTVQLPATPTSLKQTASFYQTPAGSSPRACVYVDDTSAPPWSGHAFLQLLPNSGPQAGSKNLVYGFATKEVLWVFNAKGEISSNATHKWSYKICYAVSRAQYDTMEAAVNAQRAKTPNYKLLEFNCTDWVYGIVARARIKLPEAKGGPGRLFKGLPLLPSVSDPWVLEQNLKKIGVGHEFEGGVVHQNTKHVYPNASADPPPYPFDGESYVGDVWDALYRPALLARVGHLVNHESTHPAVTVGLGTKVSIDFPGVNPRQSIAAVAWGDGRSTLQRAAFAHRYTRDGTFTVHAVAVRNSTLARLTFTVHVVGLAPTRGATLKLKVPKDRPLGPFGELRPAPIVPAPL